MFQYFNLTCNTKLITRVIVESRECDQIIVAQSYLLCEDTIREIIHLEIKEVLLKITSGFAYISIFRGIKEVTSS